MITEDYVSFEVAKLLKEKGFAKDMIISDVWYDADGISYVRGNYSYSGASFYDKETCFNCPTHQMAMKWLREVHNIDIEVHADVGMLGVKVYIPFISRYKPLESAPSKVRQIKRGIYYKDDKGVIQALQHFVSYEEAVETALKYCLENLI